MFGSFQATIDHKQVTGDYPKKVRTPRLAFQLKNDHIELYSCSVTLVEEANVKDQCDFTMDSIHDAWDEAKALEKLKSHTEAEIADVLLDQTIFMGVGNIIKNEVLFLCKTSPTRKVQDIPSRTLKKIVKTIRSYVFDFYAWRKNFELRKHYQIYRQSHCKTCGMKVLKCHTGVRHRISFICLHCQK